MTQQNHSSHEGVIASMAQLLSCRPDLAVTGFAPGGRVSTHQFGMNRSVFRGSGMEFDESRVYQPGDDTRAIDWRVSARTGTTHTKLFREERERPVLILVDERRMMQFGSRIRFKSVLAAEVAAMLCWVGIDGGDRVGGLVLETARQVSYPARRQRTAMLGFLHAISEATRRSDPAVSSDTGVLLSQALRRLRQGCRPGTLVFVISDFSDLDDLAEAELKSLAVHAHVTNILIHDPLDSQLPSRGDYRLADAQQVFALDQIAQRHRLQYAVDFQNRRDRLARVSRQRAMAYVELSTTDEPTSVLHPHRKQGTGSNKSRPVSKRVRSVP